MGMFDLPLPIVGALASLFLVLIWCESFLIANQIRLRRSYVRIILTAFMMLAQYVIMHLLVYVVLIRRDDGEYPDFSWFDNVNVFVIVGILLVFTIILILISRENIRWSRSHISHLSVQKSMDKLPIGICYYLESGLPILVNPVAESVSFEITGGSLRDGNAFWNAISSNGTRDSITVSGKNDNRYMSIERNELEVEGKKCYEVILNDVSEEVKRNNELERENNRLSQMNAHIRNLNKTIDEVALQSEILDAKVKIHDSLGQVLLMTKLYLKGEFDSSQLLEEWDEAISFLDIRDEKKDDEYSRIFEVAGDVGLDIKIDGELPSDERGIRIMTAALHECMTNAIRHAGASEMYVRIETSDSNANKKYQVEISNNGNVPTEEPKETGGLMNLRHLIEEEGGSMEIKWQKEYILIVAF